MPAFYLGMLAGSLVTALVAFAIVTKPRRVPKPFLIGRDALVPRLAVPTAYRRRRGRA